MKFVRIIDGFDHLWAVKAQDKEADELTILFRNWTNGEYLIRTVLLNSLMNNLMASKAIKFLEEHQSETPSRFTEEAAWRKENEGWLRWSRQLAVTLIGYMQDNGLKRADLAARLGVSPQYVSKLLSGTENLSFKSVANIEEKLGITCFAMT